MNFLERLRWGVRSAAHSRHVAVNPLATALVHLAPEVMLRRFDPVCAFRLGPLRFFGRRRDWGPVYSVLVKDGYGFAEPFLREYERPTVWDLGANVGTFALWVFSRNPQASVYSVEPDPATFRLLQRNREANPALDWTVLNAAVWSNEGTMRFQPATLSSTQGRVHPEGGVDVACITLDRLLALTGRTPDLLKMDIEGAEDEVLTHDVRVISGIAHSIVQVHPQSINLTRVRADLKRAAPFLHEVADYPSRNPLWVAGREPLGAGFHVLN